MGLDFGTMQSCLVSRLSKPGTEASNGELYPTIVGYPEDGILYWYLTCNAKMLHGDEAIANELHLRLVYPLSDGVIGDFDAAKSYLHTCVRKLILSLKRSTLRDWNTRGC